MLFCDQISDAILDAILDKDPEARVACEVSVGTGLVLVNGEISTSVYVDIQSIVRDTVRDIGYTRGKYGFDADNLAVLVAINEQSPDIAQGVNDSLEKRESNGSELDLGAGDQGCIKFDSLIKTDRGLITINEVKVTDKVLTRSGYNNIKDVRKTGTLSTIKLTTNLGRELELTPDHKVLVDGGDWVEAKDTLNKTVFIDHSSFNSVDSYIEVPLLVPENYIGGRLNKFSDRLLLDEDLGYLIGFLIGDGSISSEGEITFAVALEDKKNAIKEKLLSIVPEEIIKDYSNGLTVYSKVLRKGLLDLGLDYSKSIDKKTPQSIFESKDSVKLSYLRGLFDSDGSCVITGRNKTSCKVKIGSNSKTLLKEVQLLLKSFSIDCLLTINSADVGRTHLKSDGSSITQRNINYLINLRGADSLRKFNELIGFSVEYKKIKFDNFIKSYEGNRKLSFIETIVSIEDSGTHDVYDIEVETNHEFFANGILVHNCMFGFACKETDELMPLPIILAHKLSKGLSDLRKSGTLSYLRPDGKTQVTVEYDENDNPVRVDTIVISTQHDENVSQEQIHDDMIQLIKDIVHSNLLDSETKYFINPTGRFVIGGPKGDAGLTGRKIIVDTYGGYARHGGGAFSGKDATKVDRSGAYAARYIAKNIVGANLADKCEIQLSYAIGVSNPISIRVDTFGTGKVSESELVSAIRGTFDLRPRGIIDMLDLKRPIYRQTASYGHFGRNDLDLPWERLEKVDDLLNFLNNN